MLNDRRFGGLVLGLSAIAIGVALAALVDVFDLRFNALQNRAVYIAILASFPLGIAIAFAGCIIHQRASLRKQRRLGDTILVLGIVLLGGAALVLMLVVGSR